MIVVGTAGHIDHGKSAIVKRLTGTDPDRLPEEKARGLTIDLGFAFYHTPDKGTIAFIDVPGHERFVKNMIAGAGGIDAVMLVVAADDGWMPQSEEHFQVVRLLGVKHGLIVVNKIDLVEPDWLELLLSDIQKRIAGSYLDGARIFPVSAVTGEGFEPLARYLDSLPGVIESRKDIGKARLSIDRSFVRPGIGGVVTGTLRGGSLAVGQPVAVWPARSQGKVRSLQSSGETVEVARPGQRTAVSFTGIDRELLVRGGVVSDRVNLDYFEHHLVLAMAVELLPYAPLSIEDRRRVLCIAGTTEMEGEVRLFRQTELKPGQQGIVFFQPDEPMYTLIGDHFILRLPTPMVTLGGGRVIDHLRFFPRRKLLERYDYLEERAGGGLDALVRSELHKRIAVRAQDILSDADFAQAEIDLAVKRLIAAGQAAMFKGYVYAPAVFKQSLERIRQRLERYFATKAHLKGVPMEQLQKLSPYEREVTDVLLQFGIESGFFVRHDDEYTIAGRGLTLAGPVKAAHDEIMRALRAEPWGPPKMTDFTSKGKAHREAIRVILDAKEGHKCGAEFIFLTEVWDEIVRFIREQLKQKNDFGVTELRDRFGLTRKFTIPILEETDRLKITRREGDTRVKGERFEVPESDL